MDRIAKSRSADLRALRVDIAARAGAVANETGGARPRPLGVIKTLHTGQRARRERRDADRPSRYFAGTAMTSSAWADFATSARRSSGSGIRPLSAR